MKAQAAGNRIGLWVPCESSQRFLESESGVESLLALVDKHKITDVLVQVFRSGRAWFPSKVFEQGTADSRLLELLQSLNARQVAAHAWVNVCNVGISPSKQYLELLGHQEALLLDGYGRDTQKNSSQFEIDTPGIWLEPSNSQLIAAIVSLSSELSELPFSGVHLDFIRYPYALPLKPASWIDCGLDYGYSRQALERFLSDKPENEHFRSSDLNGIIPSSERDGQAFDAWRRAQINNLVSTFRQALPRDKELSVAALAWSDRAYLNAYQDWRHWLESNLIDCLCLMTYSADNQLVAEQLSQAGAFLRPQQTLFAGIGLYKLSSQSELDLQLKVISDLGANPCYFCAERLLSFPRALP